MYTAAPATAIFTWTWSALNDLEAVNAPADTFQDA